MTSRIVLPTILTCLLLISSSTQIGGCSMRCSFSNKQSPLIDVSSSASVSNLYAPATGWSVEKLDTAKNYANEIGSAAIVILHNDTLVAEWGNTNKKINSHSIRKSLLSALYGIAIDNSQLDISMDLLALGLDDENPRLDTIEKSATVQQLLQSRSGIYHPAAYETPQAVNTRPTRGSHLPGQYWYYNNWDFNALATIFENHTQLSIGQAFDDWIAKPIGLSDYRKDDVVYVYEQESIHPAYPFYITARDLARFGLLFLNKGTWNGEQIIPQTWIEASTTAYSEANPQASPTLSYGYMWWIRGDGSYYAQGTGGQRLYIDPIRQLIISHRTDTCTTGEAYHPKAFEVNRLIELVIDAHPDNQ